MRDAEKAIQELNGKVKYDTPLSVKPFTMRPRKTRQRKQSDGSSIGESVGSSVVAADDASPANDAQVDGIGKDEEESMPSLADFAARFSNVSM